MPGPERSNVEVVSPPYIPPQDTSFAQLWNELGDWQNATTPNQSIEKRIRLPVGRSQFVAWIRVGGAQPHWVISLATVLFTGRGGPPGCVALWQGLGSNTAVATAVAANAAQFIAQYRHIFQFSTMTRAFFTNNYYGSMVVVVKLVYQPYLPQTLIEEVALGLSQAWGLGPVVSNYVPTNLRRGKNKRDSAENQQMGAIAGAKFSSAELVKLWDILDALPESNESTGPHMKRDTMCWDWGLQACHNWEWSVWNTDFDSTCNPSR